MSENRIAFVARGPAVITGRHYKISWGKPAKGTFPLPLSLFAPPSLLPTISFSLTPGQQPALSVPGFVHPPVVTARIRIFSVDRRYFFAVIPLTLSLSLVSSPVYSYARPHDILGFLRVSSALLFFPSARCYWFSPFSLPLSVSLSSQPFFSKNGRKGVGDFCGKKLAGDWKEGGGGERRRERSVGRLWCGGKRGWGGKPEQGCDSAQFIADRIKP